MANVDSTPEQQCSKCKECFPITAEYWHRDKKRKTGFVSICKTCACKKSRDWGQENAEYVSERGKKYYVENKERVHKPYRQRNAEHIAQLKREYRMTHPDETKKHKLESQKRNRPSANARVKRHYTKYPERRRANTLTRIARKKAAEGKYTGEDIKRMFDEQEERCAYCGIRIFWNIPKDFHVDHIRPLTRGGANWPDNLCLACASCNQSKNDMLVEEWQKVRVW